MTHGTKPPSQGGTLTPQRGVLVLRGYGLRLAVERGHLVAEDGAGAERRHGRFPRVSSGITRLMVLGHSGTVSFDALRWLHEIGAAFVHMDVDGDVIMASAPNTLTHVGVRRAQAIAPATGLGLRIAQDLIHRKVTEQATVAERVLQHTSLAQVLREMLPNVHAAASIDQLRVVEAHAALKYWNAWQEIPLRFAGRDAGHVPAHWRTVGPRHSVLSRSPQTAATPANAILNYLYAIVAAEAQIAAMAVGCDPALGFLHADNRSRDSLAYDLMEPVRPAVDAFVFTLLQSSVFTRADFFERRDGHCRLMPSIAAPLARTALQWAGRIAPIAEHVATELAHAPQLSVLDGVLHPQTGKRAPQAKDGRRFPTPLTKRNSKRTLAAPAQESLRAPGRAGRVLSRCHTCGCDLGESPRKYCDACLTPAREAGARRPRRRRVPTPSPKSRPINQPEIQTTAARPTFAQAVTLWRTARNHPVSPTVYWQDIRPKLRLLSAAMLVRATDLPPLECWQIHRGRRIPPPRVWGILQQLIEAASVESESSSEVSC